MCEILFFSNVFMKKCRNEPCNPQTMERGFKLTGDKKITGFNTSLQIRLAVFPLPKKTNDFLVTF